MSFGPYYLQDSGSTFWQLGVIALVPGLGQWNPTPLTSGTPSVNTIFLRDSNGVWYGLTISTLGQPLLDNTVGAQQPQPQIVLTDQNGLEHLMGVSTLGQITFTPLSTFSPVISLGEPDFQWGGTDGMGD